MCVHSYISLGILSTEEDVPEAIDDTLSSITAVANGSSSDRDCPDGGEEETLPFPIPSSADHTSSIEVCVCVHVCVMEVRMWDMSYVNSLTTIWFPCRREGCNCVLPFSPVYRVQGREVWHECERISLYYTSTCKV